MTSSDTFSSPPKLSSIFSAYFRRQLPARKHIANYDANTADMWSILNCKLKKYILIGALMLILVLAVHGKTTICRAKPFYSNWKWESKYGI